MVSDTTKKWIGIFIIVAMAGSLIAGGLIYMDPDQDLFAPPIDNQLESTPSTFTYKINFDTTVLSELNSIRIAVQTDSININEINLAIRELDSVSRITQSQFVKYEEGQYYFAEIDLKRNTNINETFNQIKNLSYFNGFSEAMKRVTISVPETTTIVNSDINIDRQYTFEYETSVALVNLTTMPNDQIKVSGEISLQANNIVSLELSEVENVSNKPVNYTITKSLPIVELGEDLIFDGIMSKDIDQNFYTDSLKEIDATAQLYFFEIGENLNLFGQSKVENFSQIKDLFNSAQNFNLTQSAKFNLSEIYISELDQNFILEQDFFNTSINVGSIVNDEVNLEITIGVSKSSVSVVGANQIN